ncbi:MAG TPA: hypothetical protein VGK48_07230 [Terriglobia bacterium]|jgi:hypothetical protein
MPIDNNEYHVDMSFTGKQLKLARPIGIAVAIAGLLFVFSTMTTNIAASLLPMSDDYLQAMIPPAPDGGEAIGLTMLTHEISEKTISVSGTIKNRTNQAMANVLAVVQMIDTTGRFPQTVEVPVMPPVLPPQGTATFMTMATLQEKVGGYSVKFRFADGPFIPHKDERSAPVTITAQPETK